MEKYILVMDTQQRITKYQIVQEMGNAYEVKHGPTTKNVYKEDVVAVVHSEETAIARAIEAKSAVYMLNKHIGRLQEEIKQLENSRSQMAWLILRGYASVEDSKILMHIEESD